MTEIISTDHLTVRYGTREALSSLTLQMATGAVGLLGPNGAGKTTLLKTLLGLVPPAAGSATVLGREVVRKPLEVRLRVGYSPEKAVVIPGLNAVETVALAGEVGGLPRTVALERAHEVLRFSGLGEARYRPMDGYSMGMLQRAKLAIALVHDPELVLLDEPTSGLDPAGRRQMLDLIRRVSHQHEISVLLSTHLVHDVEAVCDSVLLLKAGKLVLHAAIDDLKREPGGVYEVRAREDQPGRFAAALSAAGITVDETVDGSLRVNLKGSDPRALFETARASGAELRHLRRFEPSLEDLFLEAVRRDN